MSATDNQNNIEEGQEFCAVDLKRHSLHVSAMSNLQLLRKLMKTYCPLYLYEIPFQELCQRIMIKCSETGVNMVMI